ncbi:MAG: hypothetical protein JST82_11825 [Bacteroidetes bacterium]|nr:hypothetical protein [Bacteroidota bacterium]
MKRLVLFFAVLVLAFSACNMHKREDAIKISNDITNINDSLTVYGKMWTDELNIAVNTGDFTKLSGVRLQIERFIDGKIEYVGSIQDVGGSENFRKSELDILKFERDSILPRSAAFEYFNESTSDAAIQNAYNNLMHATKSEVVRMENVYKLGDEYAEKNDFPKPLQK